MRISIIGAGKVGQTLGRLVHLARHEIVDVICRSEPSAVRAARFIGAGSPQGANRAVMAPCDMVIISTPDDRVPDGVQLVLSSSRPAPSPTPGDGAVRRSPAAAIHTSGALSSAALAPLRSIGISVASCHPLQTFQSTARALSLMEHSHFCIEGDSRAKLAARRLVRDIGGRSFEIPTELKSPYHAAAVLASGGLVALLSISLEILGRCGLNDRIARRVLLPLIQGTVANLGAVGPSRAMTGPIPRHDAGTIEGNRAALGAIDPNWLAIYNLLTDRGFQLVPGHRGSPGSRHRR